MTPRPEPPVRRITGRLALVVATTALVLAGCGAPGVVRPTESNPGPPFLETGAPAVGSPSDPVPWAHLTITEADTPAPGFPCVTCNEPMIPAGCAKGQVHGSVRFHRVSSGVEGVVTLWSTGTEAADGSASCSLSGASTSGRLVAASGAPVPVPVTPTGVDTINPPGSFPVIVGARGGAESGDGGPASLIVDWSGSYCGPPPAALDLALVTDIEAESTAASAPLVVPVRLPVSGPAPVCSSDSHSTGRVSVGFAGQAGQVGQPVPTDRRLLVPVIRAPESVHATTTPVSFPYEVTLNNPAATPVALQPCAGFILQVTGSVYAGAPNPPTEVLTVPVDARSRLNCGAAPKVVPAGGSVTFSMEFDSSDTGVGGGFSVVPDQTVHLSWAIVGAPTATTTLRIA
jgi:hypothetical protein